MPEQAGSLRVAIISADYPPLRTSAAVQLRDLAAAFAVQGHAPVVIVPTRSTNQRWERTNDGDVEVLRLQAPETRLSSLKKRALAEMWLPIRMLFALRQSPYRQTQWDIVVWYSPPIFFGLMVIALRWASGARCYLILRDIFPQWALDIGLLRKGPAYYFFKTVAAFQYLVADVVGVQTPSNLAYLRRWSTRRRRIEVLHNWLSATPDIGCSIRIADTTLAGRTIFIYIGNMGVAQDMAIFISLIEDLRTRNDIGFVFVGRGTEVANLVAEKKSRQLDNALFFDEIDSLEVPGLLAQCHVGMVALHPGHKTHNIPGKFVSYMQYGLPVLARVNHGTDLAMIIEQQNVGCVYTGNSVREFQSKLLEFIENPQLRVDMATRAKMLGSTMFSADAAAAQIAKASSARSETKRQ